MKSAFSEKLLPEDHFLTSQIIKVRPLLFLDGKKVIKDVHRTGCPGFDSEEDRVRLKRVLLGYARYNKEVLFINLFRK